MRFYHSYAVVLHTGLICALATGCGGAGPTDSSGGSPSGVHVAKAPEHIAKTTQAITAQQGLQGLTGALQLVTKISGLAAGTTITVNVLTALLQAARFLF